MAENARLIKFEEQMEADRNRRPDIWRDKQEIGLYEIEDMEGIEADIYGGEE